MSIFLKLLLLASAGLAFYHLKQNPLTAGVLFLCAACIGHLIIQSFNPKKI